MGVFMLAKRIKRADSRRGAYLSLGLLGSLADGAEQTYLARQE